MIEYSFNDYSELDQILTFSTPKILRLVEILREIRPLNFVDPRKRRDKTSSKAPSPVCTENVVVDDNSVSTTDDYQQALEHLSTKDEGELDNHLLNGDADHLKEHFENSENKLKRKRSNIEYPDQSSSSSSSDDEDEEDNDDNDNDGMPDINQLSLKNISLNGPSKVQSNPDISFLNGINDLSISREEKINGCENDNGCDGNVENSPSAKQKYRNHKISTVNGINGIPHADGTIDEGEDSTRPEPVDASCDDVQNVCFSNLRNISTSPTHSSSSGFLSNAVTPISSNCSSPISFSSAPSSPNRAVRHEANGKKFASANEEKDSGYSSKSISSEDTEKMTNDSPDSKTFNSSEDDSFKDSNNSDEACVVNLENERMAMADTLASLLPPGVMTRQRKRKEEAKEKVKVHNPDDPDSVCGLIFVHKRTTAKIVYRLLKELSDIGGDFAWIFPQYTVELKESGKDDPRAAEAEHKKQEEVLRRFRHHECNVLVSTGVLEEGIDIPQCNMVVRFDPARSYKSYVHSCGRARGKETFYLHLVSSSEKEEFIKEMATYKCFDKVLVKRCSSLEEGTDKMVSDEVALAACPPFKTPAQVAVNMTTAIGLLNKYCAKLPSDTFTRLTATWEMDCQDLGSYKCSIMLPINSPLKGSVEGMVQPNTALAKMSAALECCRRLHEIGELDDQLQPVGKESMKLDDHLCAPSADDNVPLGMPRPGTTKRRQYYYKKIATCLTGERPAAMKELFVYKLEMVLTCPIPDEQNTRGRRIYRPELSPRSLCIITPNEIPQVICLYSIK